jgi:N-acetyl-anhydromuramyl-L-alanine amidase AmpD
MLDIIKYGNFKSLGKQKKKRQIILCHTSREVEEYLASLKFRYNGNYDRIPNYVVTRAGKVLQLLGDSSYTNYFSEENVNRNAIIVSLENLGWLEKKPLTNYYINWKGSIYNQQVYERKWRDFFFWQPYTTSQLETTAALCNQLIESQNIERKFIGHNTKVDGVSRFGGIVSRSNFDSNYTDLNPSFNFETFTKIIENEQYAQ